MTGAEHAYALFRWARYRASQTGIEFSITPEDILIPMYCPILGTKMEVGTKVPSVNSPTLDRIDNDKGYIRGNIWVISNLANMMKNKASPSQLLLFSDWITKKYG